MSEQTSGTPRARYPFDIWSAPTVEMRFGRGRKAALIDPAIGAQQFDLHLNRVRAGDPGGPYHSHSRAENAYVVLEGEGVVQIEGESHRVEPGHAVFIPPGVPHSLTNVGETELVILEIYAPPGPDFVEETGSD